MNTRPTDPGGAAPDGYTADTGLMSGAGRVIGNAAEDARGELTDLHTPLTAADFGTKHTQWHKDYAAGIERLGQGATAMCDRLIEFAGQLGGAGESYASTDAAVADTVTAPRGR